VEGIQQMAAAACFDCRCCVVGGPTNQACDNTLHHHFLVCQCFYKSRACQ